MLYSERHFGGAAEFASSSVLVGNSIADLYAVWEAERADHPGELPVVACTGGVPVKTTYGTNYRPTFRIVKWTPRPADLPDQSPADPADVWTAGAVAVPARPQLPLVPVARTRTDELQTEF